MGDMSGHTGRSKDASLLNDLCIAYTPDPYGKQRMSIELDVDPRFGIASCQAVFDEQHRKWRLVTSTDAKISGGRPFWKDSEPNSRASPAPDAALRDHAWIDSLPPSDHTDLFLSVNWAATPLGPLDTWPVVLQTYVHFIFADTGAAAIYYGPDLTTICNEHFAELVAGRLRRSADFMAKPFKDLWPELWDDFEPMLDSVSKSGKALDQIDINLFPMRDDGHIEETFWTGSFIPIRGKAGQNLGFCNRGFDSTMAKIRERWTLTLNHVSAPCRSQDESIWHHVLDALAQNDRDFPMAFSYAARDDEKSGRCMLELKHAFGLPSSGHPLVPQSCDIFEGTSGFAPFYRKVKSSDEALILHQDDGSLPEELIQGFEWKGFGDPARSICLLPIIAGERLLGIIVTGLNPRRPFDAEYGGFLQSLSRQISAEVTAVLDTESALRRAERLSEQLADSEKQIRDLAEYGPVGMCRVAPSGKISWANSQFYDISGHPRADDEHYDHSFLEILDPEDYEKCVASWSGLVDQHKSTSEAYRLKKRWRPPMSPDATEQIEEPVWVHATAYPVVENSELTSVAASIIDISQYKWADAVHERVAKSAKEAKRLQENFIDIVSHEMRNPLSAIVQLADGITASVEDFDVGDGTFDSAMELLNSNVEAGETILLCATHQKRIIDDVLTLSKLDSMLLSITPVVVQPKTVVQAVLKMFEAEFETSSIQIECSVDHSYHECEVDWVCLDPSRLTQIFINLITNAVKFTKLEPIRKIKVRVGASMARPPTVAGVTWFPTSAKGVKKDLTLGSEWGDGEPLFLYFEVVDTGKGLEQEEMKRLFSRFQQATAKTHIKYGGSGLGLFISRELTETQGGEIGVISAPGKGSTFAFYVKARRAPVPVERSQSFSTQSGHQMMMMRRSSRWQEPMINIDDSEDTEKPRKRCLLLVEDNIVNAKVLTKQLERAGCEVHAVNHGMECLDLLARTRSHMNVQHDPAAVDFDCILMDVEMPVMDGLTATRRIRQLEKEKVLVRRQKIVVITANARAEQIESTMEAGADAVQPKPFKVKELLDKLDEVVAAENP